MMKYPQELYYTREHLWLKRAASINSDAENSWFAGITDYAQDLLGDIVFIEFPSIGADILAGMPCGLVESVKTGSDLHAPLSGTVLSINETLKVNPEKINDSPYASWIFSFKSAEPLDESRLLDAAGYQALLSVD